MADSKEFVAANRRISVVTNHLIPIGVTPTRVDSVELCSASSMDDSFHKVHGQVPTHEVVWKKVDFFGDGDSKEFVDIIYEKAVDEGIAKITINRPERRNAFRPQTVKELMRAFNDARDDSSVGVIILTGKGTKAFCSGGDQALRTPDGYADPNDVGRLNVLDLQVQIRRLPKPVIAMLFDLVGQEVTVELKNDLAIRGTLHSVDQYLNINLENTRVVDQDNYPYILGLILTRLNGSTFNGSTRFVIRYALQATLYAVWQERNKRRHGEVPQSSTQLIARIDRLVRNQLLSLQQQGSRRLEDGLRI